ncbi:PKD domain-containing protein [Halorussus litoreus]|uniref:PKD domain-containing protein n=1 Tax=Halorussus litoreus TaxID=1710536 RepID=UPI000E22AD02|nr:PKD domain-containing protein [Halorussus litoreus]
MAEQSEAATHDDVSSGPTDVVLSSSTDRQTDPSRNSWTAGFEYAPGAPVAGNPVLFEAETASEGTDARYEWAFGDGATATGEKASHVYDSGGEHAVTVTVTSDGGETRTVRRSVTVYREVAVEVGDADADGNLAVTLRANGAFDPADAVAPESLRFGAPTALAAGSGASPVRSEARDGDLRVRVPADEAGLRSDDAPGRLAGHTTDGVPVAGTAERT